MASIARSRRALSGYPQTNPNGPNGVDTAQVVVTQLPQQGVRLIRNTQPVAFGPNSRLQCSVHAWVFPPPATDPYCSLGELENAAVLDGSSFYDPNTPWPASTAPVCSPRFAARAALPQPRRQQDRLARLDWQEEGRWAGPWT